MQRVQVLTSSLRRKKYSIPGLSCVLIKITSFKTPFELNSAQWRWVDLLPEAGWWHIWHGEHLSTHCPGWALRVCSSCPAAEIRCKPLRCQMLLFVAHETERISWPDLLLLKSTDHESHRVGHFRSPSHPWSHSSTHTNRMDYSYRNEWTVNQWEPFARGKCYFGPVLWGVWSEANNLILYIYLWR